MTTMFRQKYKCAVCGTEKEFYGIASTNSFGSPDLDLRPPEMQRSTMGQWIQQCPKCGYVSGSIPTLLLQFITLCVTIEEQRIESSFDFPVYLFSSIV